MAISKIKNSHISRITASNGITLNMTNVDAYTCIAYKEPSGNVRVDFFIRSSSNIPNLSPMFTMPIGWRPKEGYGGVVAITTSAGAAVFGLTNIGTDGQILSPQLSSITRSVMGHIEYFVS